MHGRPDLRLLVWIAVAAAAVFVAVTIAVVTGGRLAIDTRAFDVAHDLRTPWLDSAARVITRFGMIAIVGPAVVLGAVFLFRRGRMARVLALLAGATVTWVATTITKAAVGRARPPGALVHTTGSSYPSGHSSNSVGWLALAIALTVLIASRTGRGATLTAGALLTVLVGLSRIYLRAHYATDVLGGWSLAIAIYALAAIVALRWQDRRSETPRREQPERSPG
jgi:undecaprenyl-diphosphatase